MGKITNLTTLEEKIANSWSEMQQYLETKYLVNLLKEKENMLYPLYHSIDIRQSEEKIAPVDSNLFPAGFNNITENPEVMVKNKEAFLEQFKLIEEIFGFSIRKILIIADDVTKNTNYIKNLFALRQILSSIGYHIEISYINQKQEEIENTAQENLQKDPNATIDNQIFFNAEKFYFYLKSGFIPDFILINHDMTKGLPEIFLHALEISKTKIEIQKKLYLKLNKASKQIIAPSPFLGWYKRSKADFFQQYNDIVLDLSKNFNFDPWLMSIATQKITKVNFKEKSGLENIAYNADKLLQTMGIEYKKRAILQKEGYIFIKSDKGTQGFGIKIIKDPNEILELSKKSRHSLHKIKFGILNNTVILQEAIATNFFYDETTGRIESIKDSSSKLNSHNDDNAATSKKIPAEKVLYAVGKKITAVLIRYNPQKGRISNLNSKSMGIVPDANQIYSKTEKMIMLISNISVMMNIQQR